MEKMDTFNRYSNLVANGTFKIVPGVFLAPKDTDYFEIYDTNKTRLDLLSYKYYNDANYDWLIMLANPSLGSLEFNIPNGTEIRIPYPLSVSLEEYVGRINNYSNLYR